VASINLYVPDALLRKAKETLPAELSLSRLFREVLEQQVAQAEDAQVLESAAG
jgi:hypothetical protein